MTVAVSRAEGGRRRGGDLRLDRQHGGERGRLRGARRAARRGDRPRGQDRDRQARAGADPRRARDRPARQLRPGAARSSASSPSGTRSSSSTRSTRTGSRARRRRRSRSCEELGEAPDALAIPVGNAGNVTAWWRGFTELEASPLLYGFQAEGAAPLVHGAPGRRARDGRLGDPDRQPGALGGGDGRIHLLARARRGGLRRADPRRLRAARLARGRLLRARLRRLGGRHPRPRPARRPGGASPRGRSSACSPATASRTRTPRSARRRR